VGPSHEKRHLTQDRPFTDWGIGLQIGTPWDGYSSVDATAEIVKQLHEHGYQASQYTKWRLRDWLISRQRYWGAPIPIVHCGKCGTVPVPFESLPVELPQPSAEQFKGRGGNPLDQSEQWVNTDCPKCQGPARRDTDTMDTFMDSAWYFFRFTDPHNADFPVAASKADAMMPVDFYVGGVEHAILHLLYARFMAKFLASDEGGKVWSTDFAEPFSKLVTQGMVHGKTYSDPATGRFLKPDEVDTSNAESPIIITTGATPNISFEKMSKSKYNGVDPAACIARYGADVTRVHMLFAAPEGEVLEWEEGRIVGMTRWLSKVWRLVTAQQGRLQCLSESQQFSNLTSNQQETLAAVNATQQSVDEKLQHASGLNTVVSDLIKLTNAIEMFSSSAAKSHPSNPTDQDTAVLSYSVQALVRLMAPLTPAFSEECWQILHRKAEMHSQNETAPRPSLFASGQTWPGLLDLDAHPGAKKPRTHTFVVSLNGKVKFTSKLNLEQPPPENEDKLQQWIEETVFASSEAAKWLGVGQNRELFRQPKTIFHKRLDGERWIVNMIASYDGSKA
jgi:leucyl-tRNA synthetase